MRAAEFLRGLADMMSAMEDDKPAQAPVIVNVNGGNSATSTPAAANPKQEPELQDDPTMVPPLQQKLEIMKKLAGLPNQADTTTAAIADEDEPYEG
jgi:hypothetical protein